DGVLVPGGFGIRGVEGKVEAIRFAREGRVPYLGICLGLQCAVIEVARNLAGMSGANSSEFDTETAYPVIDLLPDQRRVADKGGTMRLGLDPCRLQKGSRAEQAYGDGLVFERHRHRYEVNNRFRRRLEDAGLVFSGTSPDGRLVEMVELPDHPWFVAGQFHPEFRSRPTRPHPLFRDFIGAATQLADARDRAAAPMPAPAVRPDGVPAHRNGDEAPPAQPPVPVSRAAAPVSPAAAPAQPPVPVSRAAAPAQPPVPVSRAAAPVSPAATPAQPPVPVSRAAAPPPAATVDLRADGLADPVRHDDDPPVPPYPIAAGEPGRA
ncbi:MAG TPA: gamma-glutamyl-gamma-aminobutyrate hydrolase family protein, partial [Actinomycetes bacterium]|nr:gamma-glutamyl-gamma-aminobutyrate hydrolase family protein [Actinomycetes bacterium]